MTGLARRLRSRGIRVCGLVLLGALQAGAQQHYWNNESGGSFGTPGNWASGEVPSGEEASALFDLGQDPSYTVAMDEARTIGSFQVRNDRVILDLDGFNFGLAAPYSWTPSSPGDGGTAALRIGTDGDGLLQIVNSNMAVSRRTLSTTGLAIGAGSYSGHLLLDGPLTRLFVSGTGTVTNTTMASGAPAFLSVLNGAEMQSAGILEAGSAGAGHTASILIDGAGSDLRIAEFRGGIQGAADVVVQNAGSFRAGNFTYLSYGTEPVTMTVDNSTATFGNLFIGAYRSEGVLRVINGSVTGAGSGHVGIGSAHLSGGNSNASGLLEVIGQGSTFTQRRVDRGIAVGGNHATDRGSSGELRIMDGGFVSNDFNVWLHSKAILTVSAGTLEVGNNLVAAGGASAEPVFNLTLHSGLTAAPVTVANDAFLGNLALSLDLAPGFDAAAGAVFEIISYGGALDGFFLDLAEGATIGHESGYSFLLGYGDRTDDAITLEVSQIPEPGTLLLLLAGAGLLAVRRRV